MSVLIKDTTFNMPGCSSPNIDCSALSTVSICDDEVKSPLSPLSITRNGDAPALAFGPTRKDSCCRSTTGFRDEPTDNYILCESHVPACRSKADLALATSQLAAKYEANVSVIPANGEGCKQRSKGGCCKPKVCDQPPVLEDSTFSTCFDDNDIGRSGNLPDRDVKEKNCTEGAPSEDDKATLCPCCVDLLLKNDLDIPLAISEDYKSIVRLTKIIDNVTYRLHMCCMMLAKASCPGKPCCYRPITQRKSRTSVAPPTADCCTSSGCRKQGVTGARSMLPSDCSGDAGRKGEKGCPPTPSKTFACDKGSMSLMRTGDLTSGVQSSGPTPVVANREIIRILVTGMDCQDCGVKVTKAALRLPSVQPKAFDYINATADFLYDSDTISAESISKYIAKATGFGTTFTSNSRDDGNENVLQTLLLSFDEELPRDLLARYNTEIVHDRSAKGLLQISFPVRGPGAILPRDIMREFQPFNVTLLPERSYDEERVNRDLRRIGKRTMTCVALTIPVLVLTWADLPPRPIVYQAVSFALATCVELLAWPLISSCIRSVIYLHQMDLSVLVAVSTLTAWIFSAVAFAFYCIGRPFAEPYFETVTLLVTLVYVGKVIQVATRRSSGSAVRKLQQLQIPEVLLLRQVDGEKMCETMDARLLHHGDTIRIKPATIIPTDGIVAVGISEVEESYVTGESIPVLKKPGDLVSAGTLNLDGVLDVEITSLVHENSLAKVTALVNRAQAARSRYQDLADQLSAIVLPVATVAALASFLVWLLVNRLRRGLSWTDSALDAISYAIAVMAMSCPCALGLAVATVVSAITRVGIREGVFYRSAEALQRGHNIDVVAFDKTGTGVSATFRGYPLLAGSQHFTNTELHPLVAAYTASGLTIWTVTLGHHLVAVYGLADRPRAGSEQLIGKLMAQGKQVIMLSGDHSSAVGSFANSINLPISMTTASCSPVNKANIITSYQRQGFKVCFIGDGTNDSIAMSTADLSLSLVAGSEIAKASSDVVLLGTDLNRNVLSALSAAEICHLHVVLAMTWCVIYAVFAILLASGATVKFRIAPQWAGLGEIISILPIIVIAAAVPLTWRIKEGLRKM